MHLHSNPIATRAFLLIATLFLLVSCNVGTMPLPTDSTFIDNQYDNTYFKFKVEIPHTWYSADEETMRAISNVGKDMLFGDDKNMEASINAAQKNTYRLLQIFMVAPGTPIDYYNSNISFVAERVKHLPGIKTGKDYLLNSKQVLNSGQVHFVIDEEIHKRNIGGQNFYCMNTSIVLMNQEIEQTYFAMYRDGIILAFVVSYSGEEQKATIEKSINSISFY